VGHAVQCADRSGDVQTGRAGSPFVRGTAGCSPVWSEGWTLFGIVWGLVALGLAIKLTPLNRVRRLSTGLYLAMGWTAL
jgi:predicted membrane channel-forming protein YqfA (hemolysin III family)